MKKEIKTREDIELLVDTFYARVRQNEILQPVFEKRIQGEWDKHLNTMYEFWQTILLQEFTYKGQPFPKHASLPVQESHFQEWITLFHSTIDDHFEGQKADEAKWRSSKIAEIFMSRIFYTG